MVDFEVVCCMCGDVGFSDKLFRCNRCLNRFQHSYCSNYYSESAEPMEQCDWCRSEQRSSSSSKSKHGSRKSTIVVDKNHDHDNNNMVEKTVTTPKNNNNASASGSGSGSGVPSPRTATRRYKLLKDVMC